MKMDDFKEIKRVLWVILGLNLIVAVAKMIMGSIINSASMIADGFHSLTDGTSNVVGIVGISYASQPVDDDHPYGHRKIETLTGLFIVGMLVYLGFKIIGDAVTHFSDPTTIEVSMASIGVMVVTLLINLFVSSYELKKGKALNSTILISDSMHTRSDIYVTIGVLSTLVAIKLGAPPIVDPIASIVVAFFIFKAAFDIFMSASNVLLDSSVADVKIIREVTLSFEPVKDLHKIRSRGTESDMHIDMHVLADPDLTLEDSHTLAHEIEKALNQAFDNNVEVIIHFEPFHIEKQL